MTNIKTINISDLREYAKMIFDHLEEKGIKEIPLEADYYWVIGYPEIYNPYETPIAGGLGQLYDDRQTMKERISENDSSIIGWDAKVLSSLLRYVGEIEPS